MAVRVEDLRTVANQLLAAVDVYDQFVEGRPDEGGPLPDDIERFLEELDGSDSVPETEPGVALAAVVEERYYEAREVQAEYIEQAREQGRSDWSQIVEETEPVRTATRRVHTAGYGTIPEADEPDYLLSRERCPARRVSMNAGSSPVVFEDRVAQYRAIANHFDLSPELVYHPGPGHDVSPSEAFQDSRVVYVDIDEAAMTELNRAGYEAVGADATAYELAEPADVMVFRNAGLVEEAIVEANLRAGGWVLANDHLESATHMAKLDSLELVGVVPDDWLGDSPPVRTTDLGSYFSHSVDGEGTPLDLYVFRDVM
jgi:hypothetical protein